jgi:hypothetical protein
MIPTKGSLVNFSERKPSPFVGILDVEKIIVEVMVGIVTTSRLCSNSGNRRRSVMSSLFRHDSAGGAPLYWAED